MKASARRLDPRTADEITFKFRLTAKMHNDMKRAARNELTTVAAWLRFAIVDRLRTDKIYSRLDKEARNLRKDWKKIDLRKD